MKNNGEINMFVPGSFETITDEIGQVVEKLSFDPCLPVRNAMEAGGRRRNPTDWTYNNVPETYLFDRGYTGHSLSRHAVVGKHLDNFNLINMNGRVYDPWLGRFLSPDPFVQAPTYSQNFNRYSYALNNPLKYTDPTGYTMEEWLNTVHNPYRALFIYNSTHSINARSGFSYGNYRYKESTGETINTWTGEVVQRQDILLKMQLVKTGYISIGYPSGEMISYNGGEAFPEIVIKTIDTYEAQLKPQFRETGKALLDAQSQGGGDLNLSSLVSHYIGGSGDDYYMNKSSFDGLVSELKQNNKLNYNNVAPVPNMKGLYQLGISSYGTSYENAVGYATLYLNASNDIVGYSDWWNFEAHPNGDRGWWAETKTWIGSNMPGAPFMVLYGTTPPVNQIPRN